MRWYVLVAISAMVLLAAATPVENDGAKTLKVAKKTDLQYSRDSTVQTEHLQQQQTKQQRKNEKQPLKKRRPEKRKTYLQKKVLSFNNDDRLESDVRYDQKRKFTQEIPLPERANRRRILEHREDRDREAKETSKHEEEKPKAGESKGKIEQNNQPDNQPNNQPDKQPEVEPKTKKAKKEGSLGQTQAEKNEVAKMIPESLTKPKSNSDTSTSKAKTPGPINVTKSSLSSENFTTTKPKVITDATSSNSDKASSAVEKAIISHKAVLSQNSSGNNNNNNASTAALGNVKNKSKEGKTAPAVPSTVASTISTTAALSSTARNMSMRHLQSDQAPVDDEDTAEGGGGGGGENNSEVPDPGKSGAQPVNIPSGNLEKQTSKQGTLKPSNTVIDRTKLQSSQQDEKPGEVDDKSANENDKNTEPEKRGVEAGAKSPVDAAPGQEQSPDAKDNKAKSETAGLTQEKEEDKNQNIEAVKKQGAEALVKPPDGKKAGEVISGGDAGKKGESKIETPKEKKPEVDKQEQPEQTKPNEKVPILKGDESNVANIDGNTAVESNAEEGEAKKKAEGLNPIDKPEDKKPDKEPEGNNEKEKAEIETQEPTAEKTTLSQPEVVEKPIRKDSADTGENNNNNNNNINNDFDVPDSRNSDRLPSDPLIHNPPSKVFPSHRHLDEDENTHFMTYFVSISIITIIVYVTYHNRKKILGLMLEGRGGARGRRSRGGGGGVSYSKLRVEPMAEDSSSGRADPVRDFIY